MSISMITSLVTLILIVFIFVGVPVYIWKLVKMYARERGKGDSNKDN